MTDEEIQLLRVLIGACAAARRSGTAATAKVAIRYEELLTLELVRLEQAGDSAPLTGCGRHE